MIDILLAAGGWRSAKWFERDHWNARECRQLAHDSKGAIVSGNRGYCHQRFAGKEGVRKFLGRMQSQIKNEQRRYIKTLKYYHDLYGAD